MNKYCEKCGATLNGDEKFCTKCGTEIKQEEIAVNSTTVKNTGTIDMKQLIIFLISVIPFISIFVSIFSFSSRNSSAKLSESIFDLINGSAFNGDLKYYPDDELPMLIIGIIVFMIFYIVALICLFIGLYKLAKGDSFKFLKILHKCNVVLFTGNLISAIIINLDVMAATDWDANFHVPIVLVALILLSIVNIAIINKELPSNGDYYSNINLKKI